MAPLPGIVFSVLGPFFELFRVSLPVRVATPHHILSSRVYTRRHPSSLCNPAPDPKKALRVRLHKLSSRTLLVNLGQEALSDIRLLFTRPVEHDIMDIFSPCKFANIRGYPNDTPKHGMDKLPIFQGDNAISANSHLKAFSSWLGKYARSADFNHEDVKMTLFVLSLEGDALYWFTEKPQNSFDSLQSIVNAFKEKYGDKREGRHLVKAISIIKKR